MLQKFFSIRKHTDSDKIADSQLVTELTVSYTAIALGAAPVFSYFLREIILRAPFGFIKLFGIVL